MSISVEYLYRDMKNQGIKLIAGENSIANKVRWTHIVESEEIASFIQGEELIFTTTSSINDQRKLFNIIKITKEKNASGIVINTGKYMDKVDQEIIDYCNENNYPLFIMPWNVRITDIMKGLTIKIIESERMYIEITNAIKDAIFIHTHGDLYVHTLEKLGFKSNWRYIVSIIELEPKGKPIKNVQDYSEKVKLYIEENLNNMRSNYFAVNVGKSVIIIFYNKKDWEVGNILKDLYVKITKKFEKLSFYVGIGKHTHNLENLYRGYEEAKNVAKINRLIMNDNVHIRYSEVGIYRLLLGMDDKTLIKEFHDETIGELELHDKINNTDYIQLLISYFENNCNVNETAKNLYLHRNTVNYKLNKIEEILDINLSDIGDKCRIYLSLMTRYLL